MATTTKAVKRHTVIIDDSDKKDLNTGKYGATHAFHLGGRALDVFGGARLGIGLMMGLGLHEKLGKPTKVRVTITVVE